MIGVRHQRHRHPDRRTTCHSIKPRSVEHRAVKTVVGPRSRDILRFEAACDVIVWFTVELIGGDIGQPRREIGPVGVTLASR